MVRTVRATRYVTPLREGGSVPAIVEAISNVPDQDGFVVVDLLVQDASAALVASEVSTGQFALIVTKRG